MVVEGGCGAGERFPPDTLADLSLYNSANLLSCVKIPGMDAPSAFSFTQRVFVAVGVDGPPGDRHKHVTCLLHFDFVNGF